MVNLFLQFAGGLFYLLNKVFFAMAERTKGHRNQQKWRMAAWMFYLIGVPFWVSIFISEHNWIAAAVETSGVPAILMGYIIVWRGNGTLGLCRGLNYLAQCMIVTGLCLSLYDFGGLITFNQVMEIGIASGFLFGTYFLAKSKSAGYIWLTVGNACAALLMMWQEYYVLMGQQIISILLVSDAYRIHNRRN
jgi:hypothetical protein